MLTVLAPMVLLALAQPSPASIFDRPAPISRWDEGLPLGNGLVGVLVWGDGRTLRLSLDRADLWDTRLPEVFAEEGWTYANMVRLKEATDHKEHQRLFDMAYDTIPYPTKLPAGRIEVTLPEGCNVSRFAYTPGTRRARVSGEGWEARVDVDARRPLVWVSGLPEGSTTRVVAPAGVKQLGYPAAREGALEGVLWYEQDTLEGTRYGVDVVMNDRGVTARVNRWAVLPDPVKDAARFVALAGEDRPGGEAERAGDWLDAASVRLPDARLQEQYDLCKHLYIAGSRADAPPIALQGVWTADEGGLPPWKGDYHNDLNTQMTYLAYHAAGLNEQGAGWLNFNWGLLPAYRKFASEFYGLRAAGGIEPAVVPGVMTIDGKAMGGWGQYSLSPGHSAWIAQSFYLHWRYTADTGFLRGRARPFCESVGEALRRLAPVNAQGWRRLPLSTSPEIHDNSYAAWLEPNSNYDLAMLRFIFAACAEMAEADGDAAAAGGWRADLAACEAFDTDPATGLTFARGAPFDQSHRHFSHAMAIHPLGLMTVEGSDADRATIRATLAQLEKTGTDWWCGYSFSWAACLFARCGEGEKALDYLTKYLAFTGPNGFHLNGDQSKSGLSKFTYRPFTLEGNFLAMQAVQEMLLQSWGDVGSPGSSVIRVFPAVSERWPEVSFMKMRAEGGVRVSAERRDGRTQSVRIEASRGGSIRVRDPFAGRGAWNRPARRDGEDLLIDLGAGEAVEGHAPGATDRAP